MVVDLKSIRESALKAVKTVDGMVKRLTSNDSDILSTDEKILLLAMAAIFTSDVINTLDELKEKGVYLQPPSMN